MNDSRCSEPGEGYILGDVDGYEGLSVDEMVDCAMVLAGVYDEFGDPEFA